MTTTIKPQIINDARGLPAFVVLDIASYCKLVGEPALDLSNAIPSAVVDAKMDQNISALRAWRKHLELTKKEVAARLGISQALYSQHEKAKKLNKAMRSKIAPALGLTPEQLNW